MIENILLAYIKDLKITAQSQQPSWFVANQAENRNDNQNYQSIFAEEIRV